MVAVESAVSVVCVDFGVASAVLWFMTGGVFEAANCLGKLRASS
jgi:hypothetical protein